MSETPHTRALERERRAMGGLNTSDERIRRYEGSIKDRGISALPDRRRLPTSLPPSHLSAAFSRRRRLPTSLYI